MHVCRWALHDFATLMDAAARAEKTADDIGAHLQARAVNAVPAAASASNVDGGGVGHGTESIYKHVLRNENESQRRIKDSKAMLQILYKTYIEISMSN